VQYVSKKKAVTHICLGCFHKYREAAVQRLIEEQGGRIRPGDTHPKNQKKKAKCTHCGKTFEDLRGKTYHLLNCPGPIKEKHPL